MLPDSTAKQVHAYIHQVPLLRSILTKVKKKKDTNNQMITVHGPMPTKKKILSLMWIVI